MTDAHNQAITQIESIVAMIAAVNVDYGRLEELRELRNTPRFVAGWNMPGYMPDSEPASFDNFDDAKRYIIGELKTAEDCADNEDVATEFCHAAEDVNLESSDFGITVAGDHYWVTQDGNMLEPDDAEELTELEESAGDCANTDDAQQRIYEDPLSVEFRSGWVSYGDEMSTEEFRIVLCTGGPHIELVGDVDCSRIRVLYKDWGGSGELFDFDRDAVAQYVAYFVEE